MPTKKSAPKKRVPVKKTTRKKVKPVEKISIQRPSAIPLVLYRRIAISFVVIVAAALASVLYLSTMQAVIIVDSTQSPITAELVLHTREVPVSDGQIKAQIFERTIGKTKSFVPSAEGAEEVVGTATGKVTIHSTASFNQPLVKTTRLLTGDGKLFRLSSGVTVPAGGSVEAGVYADVDGKEGDIGPTRFSIPGLSEVRQKLIYAESSDAFVGGVSTISVVSEDELENAAKVVEQELVDEAQQVMKAEMDQEFSGESLSIEVTQKEFSIKPNTQADKFDVTMTLKIGAVYYDRAAAENIAVRKLYEGLGKGQAFTNVLSDEMKVEVQQFSQSTGRAVIHVSLSGQTITSKTSAALGVSRFVGMTEEEVRQLLLQEEVAESVDVEFFPFWVRRVPRLKDHIYIEIR